MARPATSRRGKQRLTVPGGIVDETYLKAYTIARRYLRRDYVTGIAVGYAMKAGDYIGELAIRIHVQKKREKSTLTKAQRFPELILGIRVDVIEMSFEHQNALGGVSPLAAMGFRPGARIETETGQIGSIGLIVRRRSDRKLFALSAAHVLRPAGDAVFHPDRTEPSHEIGDVTTVLDGVLDAGIVDIGNRQFSNQPAGSNQQITSVKVVDNKEELSFSGMHTNTTGCAFYTGEAYFVLPGGAAVLLKGFGLELVEKPGNRFTLEGDSGGLWYNKHGAAVGLLIGVSRIVYRDPNTGAVSSQVGFFASHVTEVMEALGVELP